MVVSNPFAADGFRSRYGDASISGNVLAAGTGGTLITAKSAKYTVFVQKITVSLTTSAAQSILFKDSAGTPIEVALVPASATGVFTADFGARGFALTEGKNLVVANTAGPAYAYTVEAYQKATSAEQATTIDRTI